MNYLDLIKKEIESALAKAAGDQGKINFSVEIPELEHGDVTSNFCLVASKVLKKSPHEIFELFLPVFEKSTFAKASVDKVEFKNPGFANFYFKSEFVRKSLTTEDGPQGNKSWWEFWKSESVKDEIGGEKYFGKKVLVEFTSINLFKPFTIGHLMSNFTGEYISRSLESLGAKVVRISYPSDISIGIAKAIFIIKHDGGLAQEIFSKPEKEIVKYMGGCYVRGVAEYKKFEEGNDLEKIQEVKNISNNLYGNIAGEDLEIFEKTKEININYFKGMVGTLGTKFDDFIFESEAGQVGKKIVLENTPPLAPPYQGGEQFVFQRSEGAIVYVPSEERKDISTSVFINSEGNPTYLAKDIGLLDLKFKKYPDLDYSIYVVDNEQTSHFRSVFDAAGKLHSRWEDKSIHVSHGRMTFKGQKMSSRLGGVPSAEEVIEAVYEDVIERSDDRIKDLSEAEKINLQKEIALSALRISILRSKPGVNIDFDPEKASSFEGDSGPYLCYTHARCYSLLEKGKSIPHLTSPINKGGTEISKIERKVLQFSNILKTSAEEIAPQKLVKYLFELSGEFNSFYAQHKIILTPQDGTQWLEKMQHNLYLTKLVKDTLNKGLGILGINAPIKM
jgi:arginyl-tRNA synthetase